MIQHQTPNPRICLLSIPGTGREGSHILVLNFLQVLMSVAREIHLITGNYPEHDLPDARIRLTNVADDPATEPPKQGLVHRALKYVAAQLKMSYHLARIAPQVDVVIFFLGGSALLLPMLAAKLRRRRAIIVTAGSGAEYTRNVYGKSLRGMGGFLAYRWIAFLESLGYRLCDSIVVYSPILVRQFALARYQHKILIAHEHFIYLDRFQMRRPLQERRRLVGYIGRFSEEKGTLHFMEAIARVLEAGAETTFLIGGDGELRPGVEQYAANLRDSIRYVGWISRQDLPDYLNELKLLVLPSYTEGLPNIMLEAMACGTPVLATPVGAIPDVISDAETGFLMADNSPDCIAQNVVRALNHPDLEQIAGNARMLVEREFTYEAAVERYRKILNGP